MILKMERDHFYGATSLAAIDIAKELGISEMPIVQSFRIASYTSNTHPVQYSLELY